MPLLRIKAELLQESIITIKTIVFSSLKKAI